jgi:hypothetical protein
MENVKLSTSLLLEVFEIQELENRLENKWAVDDCACICDCKTGEIPEKF